VRAGRQDDGTAAVFHGAWESPAFTRLLRNAIDWGVRSAS